MKSLTRIFQRRVCTSVICEVTNSLGNQSWSSHQPDTSFMWKTSPSSANTLRMDFIVNKHTSSDQQENMWKEKYLHVHIFWIFNEIKAIGGYLGIIPSREEVMFSPVVMCLVVGFCVILFKEQTMHSNTYEHQSLSYKCARFSHTG